MAGKPTREGDTESARKAHSPRARDLLRNTDFVIVVAGQTVSLLGTFSTNLVAPLLALALTHSPTQAGLVSASALVPYLVLALPAGAYVDRWNRRTVMLLADLVRGVAFLSMPAAYLTGQITMTQLYVVSLVSGCAFVFFNVAEIAALPKIVAPEHLALGAAFNSVAASIASLVGPALGGVLVSIGDDATFGAAVAYALDGFSFVASMASLLLVRRALQDERSEPQGRIVDDIRAGLRYVWREKLVRHIAVLQSVLSVLWAPLTLAVILLIRDDLHASAAMVGLVFSAGAAGGILGGVLAPIVRRRVAFGTTLSATLVVWTAGTLVIAFAPWPIVAMIALFGIWCVSGIYDVAQLAFRLGQVPDAYQGRVNSSIRFMVFGIRPAAVGFGGVLLGTFGSRTVILGIAAGLALTALVVLNSDLRHASDEAAR